jgi:integrase
MRSAEVVEGEDGTIRVRGRSKFYMAKYRDGSGNVVEVSTGCRDETAARQVLADLMKRSEHVRAGILTAAEDAVIEHQAIPLMDHQEAYLRYLEGKRVHGRCVSANHCSNVRHNLARLIRDCRFERLSHLARPTVERWLEQREKEGMAARTRNAHLAAIIAFGNWCVQTHRLVANPFNRMPKANEKADPRRRRRALTEEELVRLLDVARSRPLVEAMTVRRGQRKGQAVARVRDETRRRLERLGWERALIYKTLVLTGLRKGELASLTVGQLEQDTSDGRVAYAVLMPNDEKNGQGSEIPLRPDLAADLRAWLTSKLELAQEYARLRGQPIPSRLPPETPLLDVPDGLLRIFNLDLVAAGLAKRVKKEGKWVIDKRDDRGRTIDVHALRHTFGTHLSKGGVAPRTGCAPIRL